ncbi:MAG: hypothetical protein J6M23_02335 [Bacteroidales bacterium]|nr:hypothetical protein [Bacteroidales bacterium]
MKKMLLLIALAFIPMLADAQVVRNTVHCGIVSAKRDVECSFGARLTTNIVSGERNGELVLSIYNTKVITGGSFCYLPYEELPGLLQTFRYAKENPPVREITQFTSVIYRGANLTEFSFDITSGSKPELYIRISPNTPTVGAEFPWTSIDELMSVLEKCYEIMSAHCSGN